MIYTSMWSGPSSKTHQMCFCNPSFSCVWWRCLAYLKGFCYNKWDTFLWFMPFKMKYRGETDCEQVHYFCAPVKMHAHKLMWNFMCTDYIFALNSRNKFPSEIVCRISFNLRVCKCSACLHIHCSCSIDVCVCGGDCGCCLCGICI